MRFQVILHETCDAVRQHSKKMNFFDKFQNWNINQMHSICWSQRPKQILAKDYFALLKKELHGFKLVA